MPTYEYQCQSCKHHFEAFQSMKDKPLTKCPKCGKKVQRLISPGAGFIFKGSGFYITDYRSKSYQEGSKKESGNKSPSSSETKKTDHPKPKKKSE